MTTVREKSEPSLPRGGELFDGKYRIGSVLGIGGMAAVFAAKHLGFDETVAIKILLPECCDDPAVVERFVQEGKAAIKIRSEHVVRMLDVGVFNDRAYLVMEFLDGKDLDVLVRSGGPLAVETAVDLLLQACEAISEAHVLGIVHRDLKPANLFLTHRVDGSPCVKVLDFGISKMPRSVSGVRSDDPSSTLPSIVMGSPQYMSPEQMVSSASADQRSDIWSLGAILYELVTGHIAFAGATTAEVCARVLRGSPVPLEERGVVVPGALVDVLSRCFEKEPALRFANVAELARALAPLGTNGAHASAAFITRVVDGDSEPRTVPSSSSPSIRPTAAAILATPPSPRPRHRRVSGYVVGAVLAMAPGLFFVRMDHRIAELSIERTSAAIAPAAIPEPLVAPVSPPPPVAPPEPSASADLRRDPPVPVAAPPVPRPHAHHAAPIASAPPSSAGAAKDDPGPYDAP